MKTDYVITFKYDNRTSKRRINASDSEQDALRSAKVWARLMNIPVDKSVITIRQAAYQKKTTISLNQ